MIEEQVEVTVDGVTYPYAKLNDEARRQVANIQFVDAEIVRLNNLLAVMQTARNTYQKALNEQVPRTAQ